MCWTSGTSISDSIKMLADAVRKRMKTEEIVQNRYVDAARTIRAWWKPPQRHLPVLS